MLYVFLNSNVGRLGAIISMQPADLEFRYCYVARQQCFWDFTVHTWLVSVEKASSISSWPQPIFFWHRTLTGSRSLQLVDPAVDSIVILWNVSNYTSKHSKYSRQLEELATLL